MTAVFPGSFDPFTLGHEDILRRGAKLFDKIIIAVLHNPAKAPLFTVQERLNMLGTIDLPGVSAEEHRGLLADFAKQRGAKYILRGVRTEADCAYEIPMAQANAKLNEGPETVILVSDPAFSYMSASLIREIATAAYSSPGFDDRILDQWVSPAVKDMLRAKCGIIY